MNELKLSENLIHSRLNTLKFYKEYLFEGRYGEQYSVRSVQQVFKKAMCHAGINKRDGIHKLRHSYATLLI
nr:tyrosine-type recombinase/integrase [Sinomicrobium kalidii]